MVNSEIRNALPASLPTRLDLDTRDVWNAFLIHSLLLDHAEQQTVMQVRNNAPSQAERLKPQLRARNMRMEGPGQEHWNHACDLCCWVFEKDGITCE